MKPEKLIKKWRDYDIKTTDIRRMLSKPDNKIMKYFEEKPSYDEYGINEKVGFGIKMLNEISIRPIAFALGKHLISKDQKHVLISHDNRVRSLEFSRIIGRVLLAQGLKPVMFKKDIPLTSPLLSFAVNKLDFDAGIYVGSDSDMMNVNGVRLLDSNGELMHIRDSKLINRILRRTDGTSVEVSENKLHYIDEDIVDDYLKAVLATRVRPKDIKRSIITFSPLNGISAKMGSALFAKMDFEYYMPISETKRTWTKSIPSIGSRKSFSKVLSIARKKQADLAVLSDYTAEVALFKIAFRRRFSQFKKLRTVTNEMVAALYLDYRLLQLSFKGKKTRGTVLLSSESDFNLAYIAKRHGLKSAVLPEGANGLTTYREITEEKVVFVLNSDGGIIVDPNISPTPDSLQITAGVIEMINYYKSQSEDIRPKIEWIEKMVETDPSRGK